VACHGQQIDFEFRNAERDLAYRLGGVGMQQDSASPNGPSDLGNRLKGANLVVGVHHRNQDGAGFERPADIIRIDPPIPVYPQVRELDAESFQEATGINDGRVFDLCGDDVDVAPAGRKEHSSKCVVVAFAARS